MRTRVRGIRTTTILITDLAPSVIEMHLILLRRARVPRETQTIDNYTIILGTAKIHIEDDEFYVVRGVATTTADGEGPIDLCIEYSQIPTQGGTICLDYV